MIRVIQDLYKHNNRFRFGSIVIFVVFVLAVLSFFSPYAPRASFKVIPDMPPSVQYPFGTNSRGQDIFWMMTFALRNSLLFGLMTALLSRVISIFVGLLSGYRGGLLDRILMSINDSFVVMPILPILILLSFVLRDKMNLWVLSVTMACFGWAWDARLIRALVLSLKEREFTRTSVYSGMGTLQVMFREHFPFVLPIVFSTTLNNMLWSIGMEVTLSVLGLSDITTPTIGTTIFWANQHSALISGVWWWIAAPVAISVLLFIGLYLMFTCLNEFLDPRTRLLRIGGNV
jgi:peptide/nickel transport system permease protein